MADYNRKITYKCDICGEEFEKNLRFCSHNCALQYRNRTPEMNISRIEKNLAKD